MRCKAFGDCLIKGNTIMNLPEVQEEYMRKLGNRIVRTEILTDKKSQRLGYDRIDWLDDGRILTTEWKTDSWALPSILLEIKHVFEDGHVKDGWLYTTNAQVLVYVQKTRSGRYGIGLWNAKKIADWTRTEDYNILCQIGKIVEKPVWNINGHYITINHSVFYGLIKKLNFGYAKNKRDVLPLEVYGHAAVADCYWWNEAQRLWGKNKGED